MVVEDYRHFDLSSGNVCGMLVQYPNTDGQINDYTDMIEEAHKNGVGVSLLHMYMINIMYLMVGVAWAEFMYRHVIL